MLEPFCYSACIYDGTGDGNYILCDTLACFQFSQIQMNNFRELLHLQTDIRGSLRNLFYKAFPYGLFYNFYTLQIHFNTLYLHTVNVEIFAQYIFSRISCRDLDARKFGVSENYNHNTTNRNKLHMRENLTMRIWLLVLGARKFSCAKICTFTVGLYAKHFVYTLIRLSNVNTVSLQVHKLQENRNLVWFIKGIHNKYTDVVTNLPLKLTTSGN